MVKGLKLFKKHFKPYSEQYILIGGTACDLAMIEVGQSFRATHDLDIVLCIEALTDDFITAFWDFINIGNYSSRERSTGSNEFYRFRTPKNSDYPAELELFSRKPNAMTLPKGCRLTPIPASEDTASLSAILLDDTYYQWIQSGSRVVDGIRIIGAEHLIPLKARAWLDLTGRKENGEPIDSRKIKKHRNDIFRLFTILAPDILAKVPLTIKQDVQRFIEKNNSLKIDLKPFKLGSLTLSKVLDSLHNIYQTQIL